MEIRAARAFYGFLLGLHPAGFRGSFGGEMMAIFDEAAEVYGPAWLLRDAAGSLVRQWMLRQDEEAAPASSRVGGGLLMGTYSDVGRPQLLAGTLCLAFLLSLSSMLLTPGFGMMQQRGNTTSYQVQETTPAVVAEMTLFGVLAAVVTVAICLTSMPWGMAQTPMGAPPVKTTRKKLEFDVASVRQNLSGLPPKGDTPRSNYSLVNGNFFSVVGKGDVPDSTGGYFSASNQSLLNYIVFAYKLNGTQVLALRFKEFAGSANNLPAGLTSDRFDIQARAAGNPTEDEMRLMMQALLADRFKLVVHTETRQLEVEALVLAKAGQLGPRLRVHGANADCAETAKDLPVACGMIAHLPPSAPGSSSFGGRDVSLAMLASSLPTQTGMAMLPHPVTDATGLSGTFDFSMEWTPQAMGGASADAETAATGPTFFQALREQLGLKLVPQKGPVEVFVLDHAERPTEN